MSSVFHVVIPSRFEASRLPGKPLLSIGDKTLIQHVYDSAMASKAEKVSIATDDERIEDVARSFGADVIMTSKEHLSGTDRIAEVVKRRKLDDDSIVVNVQGDEFGLSPVLINQVAACLEQHDWAEMATLCEKITRPEDYRDPAVVKVVRDSKQSALYFSRSPIPSHTDSAEDEVPASAYKHIGLYAYRARFLKLYTDLHSCDLEHTEKLEQLRVLYNGYSIAVAEAETKAGLGIDTEADLQNARKLAESF